MILERFGVKAKLKRLLWDLEWRLECKHGYVSCRRIVKPIVASTACIDLQRYNAVPSPVPSVFVMRSVMPESPRGEKCL